ncbi:hypothetical protein BX666DRAFT_355876 [Dichotomocladium elegans]|nr:hypothetical protein BX666DRAFT_355876 [Dichotomocladium elegans]
MPYPVQQYGSQTLSGGIQLPYRIGQIPSPTSPHFPGISRTAYQQMPPSAQQNSVRWIMAKPRTGNQVVTASTPPTNTLIAPVTSLAQAQMAPNSTTRYQSPPNPGPQSPIQPHRPPNTPEQVLVFQRNNKRLSQLAQEMETEAMFGPACDEFRDWLQDVRAYHTSNEAAIMTCSAIVRKNMSYGLWSSMCIFQTLYKFRHYLSEGSQRAITTWYNEICASVTGTPQLLSTHSSPIAVNVAAFPPAHQSPQLQLNHVSPNMATQGSIVATQVPISLQQPVASQPPIAVSNATIPAAIIVPNIAPNLPNGNLPRANLQPSLSNQYIHRIEYAIAPFRLQHNKSETVLPFFIDRDSFGRIWRQPVQAKENTVPISYVLVAWRNGAPDTKCEWPDSINITINGIQPKLVKWSGKDKPADLAMYLKEGKNELMIRQLDCACCYWFSIQVFVRETESAIVNKIMSKVLDINIGRNIINKLLGKSGSNEDDDLEVLQPTVRISLKCPISLMRIRIPVKGKDCRHPECFDLQSYLAISVENPKWRCPICSTYIPPDSIFRDGLNEKLLRELDKKVYEVEYSEDCDNYRISKSDDTEDEESRSQTKPALVPGSNECTASGDKGALAVKTETQSENVISLISDDEEEEVQSRGTKRMRTSNGHQGDGLTAATASAGDSRARLDNGADENRYSSNFAPDEVYRCITALASGNFDDTNSA